MNCQFIVIEEDVGIRSLHIKIGLEMWFIRFL